MKAEAVVDLFQFIKGIRVQQTWNGGKQRYVAITTSFYFRLIIGLIQEQYTYKFCHHKWWQVSWIGLTPKEIVKILCIYKLVLILWTTSYSSPLSEVHV